MGIMAWPEGLAAVVAAAAAVVRQRPTGAVDTVVPPKSVLLALNDQEPKGELTVSRPAPRATPHAASSRTSQDCVLCKEEKGKEAGREGKRMEGTGRELKGKMKGRERELK